MKYPTLKEETVFNTRLADTIIGYWAALGFKVACEVAPEPEDRKRNLISLRSDMVNGFPVAVLHGEAAG